jgi:hypothetical protein
LQYRKGGRELAADNRVSNGALHHRHQKEEYNGNHRENQERVKIE